MPDAIAPNTLATIESLVRDLHASVAGLADALAQLRQGAPDAPTPQAVVEGILAMDEQISRSRLLLPLCTTNITVNDGGRSLALSDLIVEIRSEFDALARAQLEVLIEDASN